MLKQFGTTLQVSTFFLQKSLHPIVQYSKKRREEEREKERKKGDICERCSMEED